MRASEGILTKVLYTPAEAGQLLSLGRTTIYEELASGALASVRVGSARRIRSYALLDYVDNLPQAVA
jgi:excisionase family DNA binding protein